MPENQLSPDSAPLPPARANAGRDLVTRWFLAAVALGGLIYVCFGWTPSSYGWVLEQIQAPEAGPIAGSARGIRSDEWAVSTPYFQAAVRNRFQRVNQTSFYLEDLRNFYALPLADWSLVFKPQLWAFFLLPPATAFSIYFALFMCGFLAGYHLLFRQLGVPSGLAAAAAVMVFFSGFTQFWWTTYGPLIAGLPWILLIIFQPIQPIQPTQWWTKALVCAWAFPAFVLSHVYPTLLLTFVWGALILILAIRPSLLRSPGEMAAIAAGVLSTLVVVYAYYAGVIPIMRNTVYPGHRVGVPGTTPVFAVLSEIFPFVAFRLADYQNLTGPNICEIGAVGSFLPLLTLCLMRYRALRNHVNLRNALLILLAAFTAITLWEIAPVPVWMGRILLWNTGPAQRWLFTSGLLLTLASLLIWSNRLISLDPLRIIIFVLIGPVASLFLKIAWLIHKGETADTAFSESLGDLLICALGLLVSIAAWYVPAAARASMLFVAIALMNVFAFAGFNPLQSAGPIFQVPDTALIQDLRKEATASPDGVLVDPRFFGATLNGLGFRSVAHTLLAPRLAIFHRYFPDMDPDRFNLVFNRYAHIVLTQDPLPNVPRPDVIEVPTEVFVPVHNVRRVEFGPVRPNACSQVSGGGIDRVSSEDHSASNPSHEGGDPIHQLTIEGWAPWVAETSEQGIRVLSARPLRLESLSTTTRPDIAEELQDYRFVKSGFKLRISGADGNPLRPDELVLFAIGTSHGETRLACCGCP
jgi:hypothetical protein